MQTKYLKNKLMLGLSTCAILLGLNNSSAFAQSKKLVNAKIQQNTELSNTHENRLKSANNKNRLKNRNKLVNAWKKHDPSVAPFLGSWLAYETIWSIYPSVTKGRVCLIRREMDTAVLDVGRVENGKIRLQSGWLISPKGDRLEVTASDFGENLRAFGSLEEPSQLRNVNSSYLTPLLKAYKQAGCTTALPQQNVNNAPSTPANILQNEPASVLRPILRDIQRQLPKGWTMRLPSKLHLTDYEGNPVQIYPRFENNFQQGVAIFLDTQPDCQVRACSFGLITMSKERNGYNESLLSSPIFSADQLERVRQAQQKSYDSRTDAENELIMEAEGVVLAKEKIALTAEVQAYYVLRNGMGVSTPPSGAVIWEQNGFFYSVKGPAGTDNNDQDKRWKAELIDIARSMSTKSKVDSVSNNTARRSNTMTWRELKTFAQQKLAGLKNIIPSQYPNQFANGQIAMTMLSNGGSAYVVAREGVNIPNLSSVEELRQTDGSFSAVDLSNAVEFPLPALKDTPDSLYNSSQLIEIVSWSSRYDDRGLRSEARQSQQTTLPNGQKAYYLKQVNNQGWCTFTDESAQYSDYVCVNIANSPKTALEVLKSILVSNP